MKRTVSSTIERTLFERIETLFNEHVDAVYNVAYRVLWKRDDAEDVVQATFVKAFLRLDQLKDCLLYTSPSPRDQRGSRMPSSA